MDHVLLIIHILAAMTWFGSNVVQMFVGSRMLKADTVIAAEWQRTSVAIGKFLAGVSAGVLFLTGFGLVGVSDGAFGYGDTFVVIGIIVVVIGAVVGIRFFGPQGEKAAAAYDAGDSDQGHSIVQRIATVATIEMILLLVAIIAMVNTWGV